jgi:two-component system LytT family response regulator
MRALIVDDETNSREALQTIIEDHCTGVRVVGFAGNVEEGLNQVKLHEPDLVFLDISMPGGTGFDLLKKVPEVNFEIIFVTAHDNYAIQAIRSNAIDYLLKPVSIEHLREAISKAAGKLARQQKPGNIKEIIEALEARVSRQQNKIAIPTGYGFEFIQLSQILSLKADGSYTCISLTGRNKILSTRHLKEYESLLPSTEFIRIHHSHIINLEHVKHYHRGEGGSVIMDDGSEIMVSKRKKKDFLDRFQA